MIFHKLMPLAAMLILPSFMASAATDALDSEGYPLMYVRGENSGSWAVKDEFKFTRTGDTYSISLPSLDGEFKVSGTEWQYNYGCATEMGIVDDAATFEVVADGPNIKVSGLTDVTISYKLERRADGSLENTYMRISANGHEAPAVPVPSIGISGTLPVLYINVYNADHTTFNNEIIDPDLSHKEYFTGEYWLDLNGCEWMAAEGAASIGSAEEPLPLEIKARGNFTRTAFAKKPFKLKLGKKQSMLGLSESKHFAILAHADDNFGYLRNFTGFNLGRRIGLPWTPDQQPVEVVINGDYRGLYFLTESIRIEKKRINITELDDEVSEAALISGGYLIELDNYDEDNQIRLDEKTCVGGYVDKLRITWDTPEVYSDLQKRFITDQFTAMNNYVGGNSDELWKYMDLDDAARYYLVEEIISHVEAYHGSTYMFRDRGENQKWHFSPLWDCGNGFNGSTDQFFYNNSPYGNTWIPSMRCNATFNNKVKDTWMWFMNNGYKGIVDDIDAYVGHIKAATKADRKRWKDAPTPVMPVVDNSDMDGARNRAVNHLNAKVEWLKSQFGDFTANPGAVEPARDTTPAAPLPEYAKESGIDGIESDMESAGTVEYFNLQGIKIEHPEQGQFYIKRVGDTVTKEVYK